MIVAVNKCNITKYAKQVVTALDFGVGTPDSLLFIDNYIDYLKCPDLSDRVSCYKDDCLNATIVIDCNIQIAAISYIIDNRTITFFVEQENLSNETEPVEYKWIYKEDDFDPSSPINQPSVSLILKGNKQFDALISEISVNIKDANDCQSTKTCYYTPDGMVCVDNWAECPNPENLQIINKVVNCGGVRALNVTKKN